jgi:hypothetical protein
MPLQSKTIYSTQQPDPLDCLDEQTRATVYAAYGDINIKALDHQIESVEDQDGEAEVFEDYQEYGTREGLFGQLTVEEEAGIKDASKGVSARTEKEYIRSESVQFAQCLC